MDLFFQYIKMTGFYLSRLNETFYVYLDIHTNLSWPIVFLMWLVYVILKGYISDKQLTALELLKLLGYYMVILLCIVASYTDIDEIRRRANPEYSFFMITSTAMVLVLILSFLGASKDINKKAKWILISLYIPILTIILTNGRILQERTDYLKNLIPRSDTHFLDLKGEFDIDSIAIGGRISHDQVKEVEEIIKRHHAVKECAIVAKKDYDNLVKPMACVVLKNSDDKTETVKREIYEFFADEVRKYRVPDDMYPHWFDFVSENKLPPMKYNEFYNREMKKILEMQTKAVRKAAVIFTKDSEKNDKPKAFVMLQDDVLPSENLKKELGKYVIEEMTKRHKISRYMYPNWIEFVDELPKGSDGSTEYYKLQKKFKNWSNFFRMNKDTD